MLAHLVVFISFTREATDDIRCYGDTGDMLLQIVHSVNKLLAGVLSVHDIKNMVTARLNRNVKKGVDLRMVQCLHSKNQFHQTTQLSMEVVV